MIAKGGAGMLAKASATDFSKTGFQVLHVGTAPEKISRVLSTFGENIDVTEVKVKTDARTYLSSPGRVMQHTDHPMADRIAWYCHENDREGGAQILSDGWAALAKLSVYQQRSLSEVLLGCPSLSSLRPKYLHPIFTAATRQIFFAPWLIPKNLAAGQRHSVNEFMRVVQSVESVQQEVFLKPGELLVVDNHRILHGRRALCPTSSRWLTRYWLQSRR